MTTRYMRLRNLRRRLASMLLLPTRPILLAAPRPDGPRTPNALRSLMGLRDFQAQLTSAASFVRVCVGGRFRPEEGCRLFRRRHLYVRIE